ncbi:MAG: UDP-N-acetylglucosamine 1-carboxyvinyltransferase, partial [Patescibacteria group bacterium]|nr:UDP-N-acetylglucosamine 1-carboxyvinyltransferase [Patescibacteria group bacterium]
MSETTFESTHFIIHGPTKMSGEITANGAKNSALALTMAALMTTGRTVLKNIPKIEELKRFAEIFESIGAKIVHEDDSVLIDVPAKLSLNKMNFEAAKRTRAALMLMGALAAREKKFKVPFSGGCRLGRRTVRPHIYALENLGVKIDIKDDCYEIDATKLKGAEVIMYEAGDTPTENAIMAAVMAPGQTIIRYASANYQVQDLCYFLNAMGAKISGIGTTVLSIEGVKKLKPITYHIINDPIEAMSFIAMAATTNSEITIKGIPKSFLELELEKLKRMNWKYKIIRKYKSPSGNFDFIDICTKKSKLIASPEKLHAQPYPGLNMDNLPVFAPICTQAKGTTLIHDW